MSQPAQLELPQALTHDASYSDDFDDLIDELDQVNVTSNTNHSTRLGHVARDNALVDEVGISSCSMTIATKSPLPISNSDLSLPSSANTSARSVSRSKVSLPIASAILTSTPGSRSSPAASAISSVNSKSRSSTSSSTSRATGGRIRTASSVSNASSSKTTSSFNGVTSTSVKTSTSCRQPSATPPVLSTANPLSGSSSPTASPSASSRTSVSTTHAAGATADAAVPNAPLRSTTTGTAANAATTLPPSNAPSMLLVSTSHPPPWPPTTVNNTLIFGPTSSSTANKQHHDSSSILASPPPQRILLPAVMMAGETAIPDTPPMPILDPSSRVLSPMSRLRVMVESAQSSALGLVTTSALQSVTAPGNADTVPLKGDSSPIMSSAAASVTLSTRRTWAQTATTGSSIILNSHGGRGQGHEPTNLQSTIAVPQPVTAMTRDPYSSASFDSLTSSTSVESSSSESTQQSVMPTASPPHQPNVDPMTCVRLPSQALTVQFNPPPDVAHTNARSSGNQAHPAQSTTPAVSTTLAATPRARIVQPKVHATSRPGDGRASSTTSKPTSARVVTNGGQSASHAIPSRQHPASAIPTVASPANTSQASTSTSLLHARIQAAKHRLGRENARIVQSMPATMAAGPGCPTSWCTKHAHVKLNHAGEDAAQRVVPKAMLDRVKMNMLLFDMKHLASVRT